MTESVFIVSLPSVLQSHPCNIELLANCRERNLNVKIAIVHCDSFANVTGTFSIHGKYLRLCFTSVYNNLNSKCSLMLTVTLASVCHVNWMCVLRVKVKNGKNSVSSYMMSYLTGLPIVCGCLGTHVTLISAT